MKRIAYMMHVDWNWIRQRPHYIAEKLSESHSVDLFHVRNLKDNGLVANHLKRTIKNVNKIFKVPFSSRFHSLKVFESLINAPVVARVYKEEYEYVWITSPILLQFIDLEKLRCQAIIYDCMDDVLEFSHPDHIKKYLISLEEQLLSRSDLVIVSSQLLKDRVTDRGYTGRIALVNNAVDSRWVWEVTGDKPLIQQRTLFNILYFGTISTWFDFELVLKVLEFRSDVKFTLIGPSEVAIPVNPRIEYLGPMDHDLLKNHAKNADAFIMPFIVNNLVMSVDPVKAYEYVSFAKPVFLTRYPEVEKFSNYAYLYSGVEELDRQISKAMTDQLTKEKLSNIKDFLALNTWDARIKRIETLLDEVYVCAKEE